MNVVKRMSAISAAFSKIGNHNGTICPPSKSNVALIAYEFVVAQFLRKQADARFEQATREAVKAGVIFDHKKEPLAGGVTQVLHNSDVAVITVVTKAPATRFDKDLFIAKAKLLVPASKHEAFEQLVYDCTKLNAVPHTFTSAFVDGTTE